MKNKSTAILLACFLGIFGIHRFYLKQNKLGWYYLLFCWTFVPLLISIADALALGFMDYARFNQKYNLGKSFRKKFEDDEEILQFNTDEKLEQEFLQKLEEMHSQGTLKEYLLNAKSRGEYLPRAAYAKARTILEGQKNIYNRELDIH